LAVFGQKYKLFVNRQEDSVKKNLSIKTMFAFAKIKKFVYLQPQKWWV